MTPYRTKTLHLLYSMALTAFLCLAAGCAGRDASALRAAPGFSTPQEAVSYINLMLKNKQWKELAAYCELEHAGPTSHDLESGRWFTRSGSQHPASGGAPGHPFPAGWRYLFHEETPQGTRVYVGIEIDQGDGMIQRGRSSFLLRNTPYGYRILTSP